MGVHRAAAMPEGQTPWTVAAKEERGWRRTTMILATAWVAPRVGAEELRRAWA